MRGPKAKYLIVLAAPAVYLKGVLEFSIHVISSGIRVGEKWRSKRASSLSEFGGGRLLKLNLIVALLSGG